MKLMIAEKPSVARDIAGVIGSVKRHQGYVEANGYTITWAIGHLVTLADAHEYDAKFKKWNLGDLPIIPKSFRLKVIESSAAQYKVVASLLKRAEEVIVATDAGREGQLIYELIARSVGYKGPAKRLWLSSLTEEAIRHAMRRMKSNTDYKNLYYAGFARAQADWLIGINATRALTTHTGTLLTIGRVQTPTLAMIVRRDLEIEHFRPEPYFELAATFSHDAGEYRGKWMNAKQSSRFERREDALGVLAKVEGRPGTIVKLEQKVVKEQPPQLFDLTSLQRAANQKYGFTADQTLKLAQSLYETHKVLTYPRTDSRYLSEDIVATLPRRLNAVTETFPELAKLVPHPLHPTKRVVNTSKVSDHHAIIPTEKPASTALRQDERKIYELVAKQTVAALQESAEWASTTIVTEVAGELFKTTGRLLLKSGWKAVFGVEDTHKQSKSSEDEDLQTALPKVVKGDAVQTKQVVVLSKQTKPPSPFTEASLLSAMENAGREIDDETLAEALKERGLGTPATRAAIIEKLKRDGYIQVHKRNLTATEKGRALIDAIDVDALKSPEMTGDWEHRLAQIESGSYSVRQFIGEIGDFTGKVVDTIKRTKVDFPFRAQSAQRDAIGTCPLCGGEIVETQKSYGCANWKQTGCKFGIWKQLSGHKLTKAQIKDLLQKRRTRLLKFTNKAGKSFEARLILGADGKVEFDFAKTSGRSDRTNRKRSARG
ncbi:type IA DNA topoisomerase [Alicyclobacillus fastidiosus]|uniref:DNA topoisomerase n=1 Tax=Alicyclobacillus fastidiosus TaxID=392011 RepID=A0ABV5AGS6_9BACL|nr:type IA DNA topoisomerase [Alicyclobacillus fastidiosus]WEH08951.1 DNA topoisomerase 3 [Alicyclobacillus fastidiosus]